MKKLKELSVKKSQIISICMGFFSFILSAGIIFKIGVPNLYTAILFGLMVGIAVYGIIFTIIFEAPIKIMNQRFQKEFEKILKYDGYTEIKPYTNEFLDTAFNKKVKYYAKLMENNQIEIMIYKDLKVSYKYVDYYQFKKFFSV